MTLDDIEKGLLGGVTIVVIALIKTTVSSKETVALHTQEIAQLKTELASLKQNQITKEDIRSLLDEALDKRDASLLERRHEQDRARTLEMREGIQESLERLVPKIARQVYIEMSNRRTPRPSSEADIG